MRQKSRVKTHQSQTPRCLFPIQYRFGSPTSSPSFRSFSVNSLLRKTLPYSDCSVRLLHSLTPVGCTLSRPLNPHKADTKYPRALCLNCTPSCTTTSCGSRMICVCRRLHHITPYSISLKPACPVVQPAAVSPSSTPCSILYCTVQNEITASMNIVSRLCRCPCPVESPR